MTEDHATEGLSDVPAEPLHAWREQDLEANLEEEEEEPDPFANPPWPASVLRTLAASYAEFCQSLVSSEDDSTRRLGALLTCLPSHVAARILWGPGLDPRNSAQGERMCVIKICDWSALRFSGFPPNSSFQQIISSLEAGAEPDHGHVSRLLVDAKSKHCRGLTSVAVRWTQSLAPPDDAHAFECELDCLLLGLGRISWHDCDQRDPTICVFLHDDDKQDEAVEYARLIKLLLCAVVAHRALRIARALSGDKPGIDLNSIARRLCE